MKETIIGGDVDGLVKQNYNLKPLTLEDYYLTTAYLTSRPF